MCVRACVVWGETCELKSEGDEGDYYTFCTLTGWLRGSGVLWSEGLGVPGHKAMSWILIGDVLAGEGCTELIVGGEDDLRLAEKSRPDEPDAPAYINLRMHRANC